MFCAPIWGPRIGFRSRLRRGTPLIHNFNTTARVLPLGLVWLWAEVSACLAWMHTKQ